jgi:hypothetical protein
MKWPGDFEVFSMYFAGVVRFLIIELSVPSRSYLEMEVSRESVKC